MVKKLWQYVKPFSSNTETSRTDGLTDGQTDIIAISISRVSALTRDKKLAIWSITDELSRLLTDFRLSHLSRRWCCSLFVCRSRTTRRHPATSSRIFFPLHFVLATFMNCLYCSHLRTWVNTANTATMPLIILTISYKPQVSPIHSTFSDISYFWFRGNLTVEEATVQQVPDQTIRIVICFNVHAMALL